MISANDGETQAATGRPTHCGSRSERAATSLRLQSNHRIDYSTVCKMILGTTNGGVLGHDHAQRGCSVRKRGPSKIAVVVFGLLIFILVASFSDRGNEIELSLALNLLLWAGLFPVLLIALLYFFFVVRPRWVREGIASNVLVTPGVSQFVCVFLALFCAFFVTFVVRCASVAAMDRFNETPIQLECSIGGVEYSRPCSVKVFIGGKGWLCLKHRWHRPLPTLWDLEKMISGGAYSPMSQRVILVGRKSWAGIVVDEIRRP